MIVKGKIYTTDEEARNCFRSSGLTYADLTESTVRMLEGRIAEALIRAGIGGDGDYEPQFRMTVGSRAMGTHHVGLTVGGPYFERREAVTLWDSGEVTFASWAAPRNREPIMKAFMEWCGAMSELKRGGMLSDLKDEQWCDHVNRKTVYLLYTVDEANWNDRELSGVFSTRERAVNGAHDIHGFYLGEGRAEGVHFYLTEWAVGSGDEDDSQDITEEVTGVKE